MRDKVVMVTSDGVELVVPKKRFSPSKIIIFAVLVLYLLFLMLPFYTIIISSFTSNVQMTSQRSFVFWPDFTLEAYINLFTVGDLNENWLGAPTVVLAFINTLWLSILPVVANLTVSGLAAYAFSKLRFPGKEKIFALEILTMMIPLGAFGVIGYIFYTMLGWVDTPLPLIIPAFFGGAGTVFFLRMYFDGISNEILEAARIDGMGTVGIFFKILFPLAFPAFIAQFIFGFVGHYNAYLGPKLYLGGVPDFVTLQVYLSGVGKIFDEPNVICAAAVVGILPLVIIYAFMQKLFIEGIAVGGGKE